MKNNLKKPISKTYSLALFALVAVVFLGCIFISETGASVKSNSVPNQNCSAVNVSSAAADAPFQSSEDTLRIAEPGVRNKPTDSDMPFSTIEKGTKSGIKSAQQICIREEADWVALWRRHRDGSLVSDTAPPVDFENNMVVAVFQGEGVTDSGFVEIDRIKLLPDKVLVILGQGNESNEQSESDRTTTSSFHITKTTRSALPVVFQ